MLRTAGSVREEFREARSVFTTQLRQPSESTDPPTLPAAAAAGNATLVTFPGPLGEMPAYVVTPPGEGRRPAIVWLTGGFDNSIDPFVFDSADQDNDQTASAFWRQGVITMYPSRRGANGNPGETEFLFGEVDDVLAAAEWLAGQPSVDTERLYIGGHSTGGTLALLVAELTDRFAGVISLGPVDTTYFDLRSIREQIPDATESEITLRSPVRWLTALDTPTWIIEGDDGNAASARALAKEARKLGLDVTTAVIPGETHFSIIGEVCERFAAEITEAAAEDRPLSVSDDAIRGLFKSP